MTRLIKSRRGVALEMAITLIVVTSALATLILTVAMLQHSRQKAGEQELHRTIQLEQIGEDFCRSVADGAGDAWAGAYQEAFVLEINGLTLTVKDRADGELLLTVALQNTPQGYQIVQWDKK